MAFKDHKVLKDSTGRYLTRALFVELTDKETAEKYPPMCTLKEAHDLYMKVADPTEYEFAKQFLESEDTNFWDQWLRICGVTDFKPFLDKWREELEIKLRSNAIKTMLKSAKDPEKGVTAAKWVAEKGWKEKRAAGRPSKDEVDRERRIAAGIQDTVDADAKRILAS